MVLLDHVPAIGGLCLAEVVALYLLERFAVPRLCDSPTDAKAVPLNTRVIAANNLVSLASSVALGGTAVATVLALRHTPDDRWFGVVPAGVWFYRIYIAHSLVGTGIELFEDLVPAARAERGGEVSSSHTAYNKLPMVAHHILSITAYCGALTTDRMHYYGCLDGLCEITNFFLVHFLMSREKAGGMGEHYTKAVLGLGSSGLGALVSTLNSVTLWFSFMPCRVFLFPTWMYLFYTDVRHMYGLFGYDVDAQFFADPAHSAGALSMFELTFYPSVTMFLFGLSSMWFYKMTKGVIKLLRGKDPLKED